MARLIEPTTGIGEGDPIWEAIDTGGGQTCDVQGVLRVLHERGYVIVDRAVWYGTEAYWCEGNDASGAQGEHEGSTES